MRRLLAIAALALIVGGCGEEPRSAPVHQPFEARVRSADVAGTEIAWYERGSGPALVMLMGTGSTMAEWDPALLRLLARERRLIMFDYPGIGRSGPWEGRSFDSLAEVTAGLVEELGLEPVDVLGWSMGGFVAQRLAIERPELVDRVVLAGTNPGGERTVLGGPQAQEIDSDPNPSRSQILHELYPPDRQREGRRFLRRLVRASRSGEIPDDFAVPAATVDAQVAAEDPWLRSNRNYRQLGRLEAPLLATAGRQDPVVPPANLRRIAARAPDARLLAFAGAHAFLFQERGAFSEAVNAFLGG